MRRPIAYLSVVLLLLSCAAGCKRHIISKKDMVDIYAEMFLADQWMQEKRERGRLADTTLLYEPIFNRYGYTTLDFRESVDYYLKDPERYARLLKKTASKLGAEADALQERLDRIREVEKQLRATRDAFEPYDPYYVSTLSDTLWLYAEGGLADLLDSLMGAYPPVADYFETAQADTLSVRDSLPEQDVLEVNMDPTGDVRPLSPAQARPAPRRPAGDTVSARRAPGRGLRHLNGDLPPRPAKELEQTVDIVEEAVVEEVR